MFVTPLVVPTPSLDLVLQTPDEVLAFIESLSPSDRAEVSPDWIARVRAAQPGDFWALSFTVLERSSGAAVGSCGFKGRPDADQVVEIAYGIEPARRGRGFATEVAGGLVEFAFASGQVRRARAHTRPNGAASARVLEKCGFRRIGEVIDPEDGLVYRWERGPAEALGT